jgi:hypothetical protein
MQDRDQASCCRARREDEFLFDYDLTAEWNSKEDTAGGGEVVQMAKLKRAILPRRTQRKRRIDTSQPGSRDSGLREKHCLRPD